MGGVVKEGGTLREAEHIFEMSLDMICVAGLDGRFKAVNPALAQTLGYAQDELLERRFVDFVHPDDQRATLEAFGDVLDGGEVTQFENRYITKDGTERWLQWTSRAGPGQSVVYAIARDVTESRRVTEEQAALRRVATLAAREASPVEILGAVTEEAARVLETEAVGMLRFEPDGMATLVAQSQTPWDPPPLGTRLTLEGENVVAWVHRTGQTARMDDWSNATGAVAAMAHVLGVRSIVATPIVVEGRLWGTMIAATSQSKRLPADTESRLAEFTELVATAIANAESRVAIARLAEQQAALRRVATLAAEGVQPQDLFAVVAEEVARIVDAPRVHVVRYGPDNAATVSASFMPTEDPLFAVGTRWSLEGMSVLRLVHDSAGPARVDDYAGLEGQIADATRQAGLQSTVGSPIVVAGRLWGAMVASDHERLPEGAETRLADFTELLATAIANAESREAIAELAEEQAALRRVATLVAQAAAPSAVLDAVAAEMKALLDADQVALNRFEPADELVVLARRGVDAVRTPVGARFSHDGENVTAMVRRSGQPARMEGYEAARGPLAELARATGLRSSVSVPIAVEGVVWGLITASWKSEASPPADTEERMAKFAQLLDASIANTEARAEVARLAEEQAALRRVATLVAQGVSGAAVFDAVAAEMERLLGADGVTLSRYEPEDAVTVVAHCGVGAAMAPAGTRLSLNGDNVASKVRRTRQPARKEDYRDSEGPIAELVREIGVGATVGAPIVVDGQLWGLTVSQWRRENEPPSDTEGRMAQFAELLGTAIANADNRDQLTASRARLLTAADEARRRVVRDLHDGAQQRLVHAIVTLKLARAASGDGEAQGLVDEALQHAERANAELHELAHGILPAALTRGGLPAGVDSLVERLDLPVRVDIPPVRLRAEIEASAYFVVAEALTNIIKHSRASHAEVTAAIESDALQVDVRDDGIGGADADGHGLVGMADRVTALGGQLTVHSLAGSGTHVSARFPLSGASAPPASDR